MFIPVLEIRKRIRRIRMFLGLPNPASDPDHSLSHKGVERTKIMIPNKILTENFIKKLNF
jgi:hypothetical protein